MNKTNGPADRIKIGLGIALLAVLTGCVGGYVGVDGGYGGTVVVDPLFGGGIYDRGADVHGYSQRGSASRAVAHSGGGGGARGGGGGGGGGKR